MNILEVVISSISIVLACGVVLHRKPHYASIWLFLCGLVMAVIYGLLNISHMGAIHAVIFSSLCLVLFIMVFMLDNFHQDQPRSLTRDFHPVISGLLGAFIFGLLMLFLENNFEFKIERESQLNSLLVFKKFVESYPLIFEMGGLFLFSALVGILYLLKKERS